MNRGRSLALAAACTGVVVVLGVLFYAKARRSEPAAPPPTPAVAAGDRSAPANPPPPFGVQDVHVEGDLTAFRIHGTGERGPKRQMLFISGMCVHPVGYVQGFYFAAAARGDLVTVQGDISCGGDGMARRWSSDLELMNRRIEAAFRGSGLGEPRDVIVIGYSQGAERAERLVARWPERYSSAILLASPIVPSPQSLAKARAVVLMAGTLDVSRAYMASAVGPLRRAKIPATFIELPGARHGQMGPTPEKTMAEALDFVLEQPKM